MAYNKDEITLITKIARLYYEEGKTQEEIGEIFGISRFKVLRLLQEARDIGIVTIKINDITSTCSELEEELEEKFGLKKAIVVPTRPLPRALITQEIGRWGARLLIDIIKDKDVVGVGWGATVSECVKHLEEDYKDTILVPLGGGTGQIKPVYQVNEICREMALKLKAKWYSLDIPIFVENEETKLALFKEPKIKEVLDLWDKLTVAIIGIGNLTGLWEDRSPILAFSKEAVDILREELTLYKSVGDIVQNFFDINGNISPISIRDHIISIPIEKFKEIRDVVALSGWKGKKEAILGALRTRYITHLVTDEVVAEYLLEVELPLPGKGG
ncbi:MAG: sugar-binding transcriptional regulator [bacterium]|nr:sugar-binding transcriptional regulator [bacterium]